MEEINRQNKIIISRDRERKFKKGKNDKPQTLSVIAFIYSPNIMNSVDTVGYVNIVIP